MLCVTKELLEKYVNECNEAISKSVEEFNNDKIYKKTNREMVNDELYSFDYYFKFKYFKIVDYVIYENERGTIVDDYDAYVLFHMVELLDNYISYSCVNIELPLGFFESRSIDKDDFDKVMSSNVIQVYIDNVIEPIEKKANFEYNIGDGESTEMFNEVFKQYYILGQLCAELQLSMMSYYLVELTDSLLTKVHNYENKNRNK